MRALTATLAAVYLPLTLTATLQLSWLLDVNGIPENWRALEGHSVNTFTLVNKVSLLVKIAAQLLILEAQRRAARPFAAVRVCASLCCL